MMILRFHSFAIPGSQGRTYSVYFVARLALDGLRFAFILSEDCFVIFVPLVSQCLSWVSSTISSSDISVCSCSLRWETVSPERLITCAS